MRPNELIDLMRRLGDRYRHVGEEHARQPISRGATRRRLARELRELEDRFERLLGEWVPDDALRARWRDFLHGRGGAPADPALAPPPLFKGRTDAGTLIEVRPASGGYDVLADGARIDHDEVPWRLEPDMIDPVQIRDYRCEEAFDAPAPAIEALAGFVAGRAEAPWRWVRELVEDGLVDAELALTPRGRRCLSRARATAQPPPRARNVCVLVADAARARVLALDVDGSAVGPPTTALVEVSEITNPMLRARDVEMLSDKGGGRRLGSKAPLGKVDHRDHRRRDLERHFAAQVAEEAASVWRRYPACELIVAASPVMLGLLRPAIERQLRAKDQVAIHELARDLSKLSAAMLHDRLADDQLLPARGRRTPLVPAPGLPV